MICTYMNIIILNKIWYSYYRLFSKRYFVFFLSSKHFWLRFCPNFDIYWSQWKVYMDPLNDNLMIEILIIFFKFVGDIIVYPIRYANWVILYCLSILCELSWYYRSCFLFKFPTFPLNSYLLKSKINGQNYLKEDASNDSMWRGTGSSWLACINEIVQESQDSHVLKPQGI